LPEVPNKVGVQVILDCASALLFYFDYKEFALKVHFPLPVGNMFWSLTSGDFFNFCVVLVTGKKSCIKVKNRTPKQGQEKLDEKLSPPPKVFVKPIDNDASLTLIFNQQINWDRRIEE